MNDFEAGKGFFTDLGFEFMRKDLHRFWGLAREIKEKLGNKGYYVDTYLSPLFETATNLNLVDVNDTVDAIYLKILTDCSIICKAKNAEKSEFFSIVKDYVENHPVNFEHSTSKVEYYTANILLENLEIFSKKCIETIKNTFYDDIDYSFSDEMYKKISDIVGEKCMEDLNEMMFESLVFCPITLAIAHQFVVHSMEMLTFRDPESSKQLYQFKINSK